MYVTVDEAKEYVGIYHAEKDGQITFMIEAAERHAQNFLGHDLSCSTVPSSNSPPDLDAELLPNVKVFVLEQVARWIKDPGGDHKASDDLLQMLHFERTGLGV
jgi:hypothetical protein